MFHQGTLGTILNNILINVGWLIYCIYIYKPARSFDELHWHSVLLSSDEMDVQCGVLLCCSGFEVVRCL